MLEKISPKRLAACAAIQKVSLFASDGPQKFRGRLIAAGPVRNVLNEKTSMQVPSQALTLALEDGLFDNLACFIDHSPHLENPSLRNLLGVWSDPYFDWPTQAITATLTTYDTAETRPIIDRLQQILAASKKNEPIPDIGVSLVFYPEWEQESLTVKRFKQVESADLVFFPAADGRILEALSALTQSKEVIPMTDNVQPAQTAVPDQTPANQTQVTLSADWMEEIRQSGLKTILKNADLPQVVKERLSRQHYATPQAAHAAIKEAKLELQALDEDETVQLGRRPSLFVRDPNETIQAHVDWFFGVEDAPTPPPNYRQLDQLYIALTGDDAFHGVFRKDKVMLAAADTTTLANMAVNAMNKVVQTQMSYLPHWRWYEEIAVPTPNDGSVNTMQFITWGGIGNLPTVAEGAAYTELTVDDERESATFYKKGGYVGITLEMIRNSQIVQIQAVPRALAVAAVRTRSAAVSNIFTANAGVGPTLATDSTALFHADHSNIATTAFGTDATAWRAARTQCWDHTEVNSGKVLAIFPKFCLVPSELYDVALSVFGYGDGVPTSYTPEAVSRNPADPRPVPLVVPDWTDATDWAYMVDPRIYPVIQISYAQQPGGGRHPAPELYSVTDENSGLLFTNDVMPIKIRDWFAVGVNGPRGIGKRNVA